MMLGYDFGRLSLLKRFAVDFEDLGKIGSGGFATVHKVRSIRDSGLYALKIMQIKPSSSPREDLEEYLYKMLAQAKTLADLSHPNVLRYHGCWVEIEEKDTTQHAEDAELEDDGEFEMIVCAEEEDCSDGIFFQTESKKQQQNKKQENQNQNEIQALKQGSPRKQEIHHKDFHHQQRKHRQLNFKQKNKKQNLQKSILSPFKQINIFLQTQLCESSLHSFVYHRNRSLKANSFPTAQKIRCYSMIIDIINGLEYLHSKKIIHRDIKLQNIVVDSKGRCKIIDYGLAKKVRLWNSTQYFRDSKELKQKEIEDFQVNEEELFSSSVGTKIFSSPEQASSDRYDHRTDIYSLAMVIVIIFSNFKTAHEQRELLYEIRNKNLSKMDFPSELKHLLLRSLSEEKMRPSLKELKQCVKRLAFQELCGRHQSCTHIQKDQYYYEIKEGKLSKRTLISEQSQEKEMITTKQ